MRATKTSWVRLLALFAVLTLLAVGCGGGTTQDPSEPADGGDSSEPAESEAAPTEDTAEGEGATMVFATSADPVVLDGILVSDGESLRAIDQMFEGLVTLAPGGTEVTPNLATEWEASDDGKEWTFQLRDDVTFHDGEPFNAEAVCANFERWYNFTGSFQNPNATYYWQTVFGGFAKADKAFPDVPKESLYGGCSADDEHTVTLSLTKPSASFLAALALTNFTFASPKALEEFGADEGKIDEEGIFRPTGTYGTEHPTGTGPFMFDSWTRDERLVMKRNPNYWGEFPGNIETLVFQPIADNAARLQALQTGEIHGYDLVEPQDFEAIESDGNLQLLERPAFNIGYVGFSQGNEVVADLAVRQAVAHAINRQELVDAFYAGQGEVATQFMPPELFGYADDVKEYEYDPEKAKQILEDAGIQTPVKVTFGYPTDVSRPYMPDPQANFEAMVADLEECCFEVEEQSAVWSPNYLDKATNGKYDMYLLGWTGDFGDPDNFLGTFFQTKQPQWGFENEEIFGLLNDAEVETDQDKRVALYEDANRAIMEFLPGVPYVHTKPALAFSAAVSGYQPSPVSLEPFSVVTLEE